MKNLNWKTAVIAVVVFFVSHIALETMTGKRHPFLSLVVALVVSYIIHILLFSNPEVRKLQKQAELLNWKFMYFKKEGRYRDYVYRKDIVFARVSWVGKCVIVNGHTYEDFTAVERDFENLKEETKEFVTSALGNDIKFPPSFYNEK